MKVIDVDTLKGVQFTGGKSYRPILEKDGLGFSVHITVIEPGGPYHWHYQHHLEACYCIDGMGILTNLETGEKHEIIPKMLYALDKHDDHTFEAVTEVTLISIFNPPCKGDETHDKDGNYTI